MGEKISLDHLPPNERFPHFRDVAAASLYVPVSLTCNTPETFRYARDAHSFGDFMLISGFMAKVDVARTPREVARSESISQMKLIVPLSGAVGIRQDKREALIKPGQFYFDDPARPYEEHIVEDLRYLSLHLPRSSLIARVSDLHTLTATGIGRARPHGKLALDFMASLFAVWDTLDETSFAHVSTIVFELVVAALREHGDQARPASQNYRYAQFLQAKTFIDTHLHEPSLSIGLVSAQLGVSARYVSGLLRDHGFSYRHYVLAQRLIRCASDLIDPRLARRTVTDIAFSWAFCDSAHFSRAFKTAYGMSPREYRAEKQHVDAQTDFAANTVPLHSPKPIRR